MSQENIPTPPLADVKRFENLSLQEAVERFVVSPEASIEAYEYFSNPADSKHAFLTGEVDNPHLGYGVEDTTKLDGYRVRLQKTLGAVEDNVDTTETSENAFYEIVADRTASVNLVLQSMRVDGMDDDPNFSTEVQRLQTATNELYGVPEEGDFFAIIAAERQQAVVLLEKPDLRPEHRELVEDFLRLMPEAPDGFDGSALYRPDAETMEHYHQVITETFAPILQEVSLDDETKYDPDAMTHAFSGALAALGIEGWTSQLKPDSSVISTNQEDKVIYVGENRSPASGKSLRGLLLHEVGIHVYRRVLGEQTPNPLLWNLGLRGYYPNEEGLGKIVEQALHKEPSTAGLAHYKNIGLSLGLDGQPRDFREVFEIEWRQQIVAMMSEGKTPTQQDIKDAQEVAYNRVYRVKRGMPTHVKGATYTKDLAYYNGSIQMWRYLAEADLDTDGFRKILTGKFDPLREDHWEVVNETN